MGELDVEQLLDEHQQRISVKALLDDLRASERMLETGRVESGQTGAQWMLVAGMRRKVERQGRLNRGLNSYSSSRRFRPS